MSCAFERIGSQGNSLDSELKRLRASLHIGDLVLKSFQGDIRGEFNGYDERADGNKSLEEAIRKVVYEHRSNSGDSCGNTDRSGKVGGPVTNFEPLSFDSSHLFGEKRSALWQIALDKTVGPGRPHGKNGDDIHKDFPFVNFTPKTQVSRGRR